MSLLRRRTPLRLVSLVLTILSLMLIAAPALAEGSDELTNNAGYRPFLLYQVNATTGNVINAEIFKVFAQTGERINMGSSANGRGGARIAYRAPNAAGFTLCVDPSPAAVLATDEGVIENRVEEQTGPFPGAGGYNPCFIDVGPGETGVWEVRITSPNINSGSAGINNPTPTQLAADNWVLGPLVGDPVQLDTVRWIRAWDITVTAAPHGAANALLGRVFANFLPLNLGNNFPGQPVMQSEMFVFSEDGYVYRVDANGLDAFGFHFFANNVGFFQGVDPIYRSVQFVGGNPGAFPTGFNALDPTVPDNPANNFFTHKIFFNFPDIAAFTTLPLIGGQYVSPSPNGDINFVSPPIQPPQPANFTFTGEEGTPGAAGTNPLSGEFNFDATTVSPYRIILDTNRNGTFGDAAAPNPDRILFGRTIIGTNTVIWDGLDEAGDYVPAGAIPIEVQLTFFAGEVHFPLLDPENNPLGIEIERLVDPDTAVPEPDPFQVFYQDRYNFPITGVYDYSLCGLGEVPVPPDPQVQGCYGQALSPRTATLGIDSAGGTHAWETDFGNRRGMDTWAYYPSSPELLPNGIAIREADLIMEKAVEPVEVVRGGGITYTLTVRNTGPSPAPGARVIDALPPEVLNPRWRCQTVAGGATCSQPGPVNGNIDTLVNLPVGGVLEFIITGTVDPNITAPFTNTATVLRPNDITDPNDPDRQGVGNNSASATVTLSTAPPVTSTPDLTVTPPGTGTPGTPGTPSPSDPTIRKSVEPPFAAPGDTVVYSIVVHNPGPSRVTGIRVVDTMPAELEILRAQTTSGTVSFGGQTVTLLAADLDPGETITVTVTARIRPTVPVPFSIRNISALTNNENPTPRYSSAIVLSVGNLPSTGESPRWITDLFLIVAALSVTVIVGIATSMRGSKRAN